MTVSRVVVVGKSGSGKTSLINTLVNNHDDAALNPSATIGIDFKMIHGDEHTPTIQFWDISEQMPLQRGRRQELIIYVMDSEGDFEAQKTFLLSRRSDSANSGLLVVTKAKSEEQSKIQGAQLNELAEELGLNPRMDVFFADSKDPVSCNGLRAAIKTAARLNTPRMQAGGARAAQGGSERDHLLGEHKQSISETSQTVAAEFAKALNVLSRRNDTEALGSSINALKDGTLMQIQTGEITVAKGLSIAKSTTKLANDLLDKHTHAEREAVISTYKSETHPFSRARYMGRLIGTVIGAAFGFIVGLVASTGVGPVAPVAALASGSFAAKKGAVIGACVGGIIGAGLTFFCTRNQNSARDGVVQAANAFSNARKRNEDRLSDADERGLINSAGGRKSPLI